MPLRVGGIEAWITLDNKLELDQYDVEVDEANRTVTCWISGEPGQTFALRWCPIPGTPASVQDMSGFAMMDGYELGGRVIRARTYAPAMFSRIATSPTSCLPLTFSTLPHTAGIGADWKTLGTISLDVHVVQVGEENQLHRGYSSYYRRDEGSPLSSATPFSSTEVTSIAKVATFIFKYRSLDVLRYHNVVPLTPPTTPPWMSEYHSEPESPLPDSPSDILPEVLIGKKRRASTVADLDSDSDDSVFRWPKRNHDFVPPPPDSPTGSDGGFEEASRDWVAKFRARRMLPLPSRLPPLYNQHHHGLGLGLGGQDSNNRHQAKRLKF
ncbi:hypothetical protein CVT24_003021 [Panaeolus cyanescens]|uniref:Uncharacterized protein n=1 Tax=Panaeolus cyanescens TaxID=181874 RepID=A0A409W8T7_9AGAR|nr:hypothetical protein CVT24_003021 [Panaeolus cyanescens]